MNKLKNLYAKYRHGIPLLIYMAVYLGWFAWLEKTNQKNFYVIHVDLDDYIPFAEVFVVPYLLWFFYVSAVVVYLLLTDKQNFNKCFAFLATGMTVFLLISTLWPNGHHLRPPVMPRDNVFTQMISMLWQADTPTNLWPSIHVYNSMGAHFALTPSALHADSVRHIGTVHHSLHHAYQTAFRFRRGHGHRTWLRNVPSCIQKRISAVPESTAKEGRKNPSGQLGPRGFSLVELEYSLTYLVALHGIIAAPPSRKVHSAAHDSVSHPKIQLSVFSLQILPQLFFHLEALFRVRPDQKNG